ncbi:methyltransferase [Mycobacterium decipiens]|uniref:Hydroxyneurosporene methyltransferase n=1 Tax=Mycobacterium decipiens TaxID=1430326 RepID=A0A1X2LTU5_9MYCO|nr:methyltransferase [Mycobacterium decipiens]OSC40317.1 hypothetical protein B8W66_13500 [Mycobacterium decipiens]
MTSDNPNESGRMAQRLFELIFSKVITQCLAVAAQLGIADHLTDGDRPVSELASELDVDERSLYRVLRTLASFGVFVESQPGRFGLTPLAEPLLVDSPNSLKDFAILFGHPVHNGAYADIMHSVRTGETAFKHVHGAELFDYCQTDADFFSVFNDAMTATSRREARAIAAAYPFSDFGTLADVGGGRGLLLSEVLKKVRGLKGALFDLPGVVAGAEATFEQAGVGDRATIHGGSFFEAIPVRADAYMMKYIIHDWDDEKATIILRNCVESMAPDGKVLVIDYVLPEGNEASVGKFVDIEMLVIPGGRERTRAQFETLFQGAGLELTNVVPTSTSLCIVEGVRADRSAHG